MREYKRTSVDMPCRQSVYFSLLYLRYNHQQCRVKVNVIGHNGDSLGMEDREADHDILGS